MESLPEIDVVNSNPSELLATPLNITIQQNFAKIITLPPTLKIL